MRFKARQPIIVCVFFGLLASLQACNTDPTRVQITADLSLFSFPSWGPTGLIAFEYSPKDSIGQLDRERSGIYVVAQEGGRITPLLLSSRVGNLFQPRWSPDGSQLMLSGGSSSVVVFSFADSSLRAIPSFGTPLGFASWGPDSKTITFTSRTNNQANRGVGVLRFGESPRLLVDSTVAAFPTWSISGSRIAFLREGSDAGRRVSAINVFTHEVSNVFDFPVSLRSLKYSPDGSHLLFHTQQQVNTESEIYVIGADGTQARLLVNGGVDPSWSPDGASIVFIRQAVTRNVMGNGRIWIMDVRTKVQRELNLED